MGQVKTDGLYCAYLRKSRRDEEMEALGHGETLARHEKQLRELADRLGIRVTTWYREIVSGDTIAQRPEVQQLLSDVNAGMWDGVLAMDVDRFGRGDSIDQGIIMQSFMYANVLVITPDKIYDPSNDSDAEFFEIKLFFSRREYAAIKKRMQRGRLASAMDGCYMGTRPVYGYERIKLSGRKGWSLRIVPEKADIVRSVFTWYAYGIDGADVGAAVIADRLNMMGLKTDLGHPFTACYIRLMLQNPAYIGKVQWNQRVTTYHIEDGKRVKSRPKNEGALLIDGLHDPIVDEALFNHVQQMFATHEKRPKNKMAAVANKFAGLIVCDQCGYKMQLKGDRNRRGSFVYCPTQHCPTCSTYEDVVEDSVLKFMRGWVDDFHAAQNVDDTTRQDADRAATEASIAQLRIQLDNTKAQYDKLYDFLEQGVYSVAVYRQRQAELTARIDQINTAIADLTSDRRAEKMAVFIPRVENVLHAYASATTPAEKNTLLRSVVDHVDYHKTERNFRNSDPADHLTVTVYPRLPSDQDL